ncbi:CPBP family intramembrane metalloprotease [Halobacillus fulvus]|nr:CPBP family intramembrane metalloprotease [Halobacillus fulvus]
MSRPTKAEIIKQMSDRQVTAQLVFTQLILLALALIISFFLFESYLADWLVLFHVSLAELFWFGLIPGLSILLIDFILMRTMPKRYYDDGGINEKVFRTRSIPSILWLTLLVAVSEEMLFRGVLHTEFGYVLASVLFAVMHIRYLNKPVLLISVLIVSFFIGYMFEMTGSLPVTILSHFVVDAVLGLWIRFGLWEGRTINAK